MIEEVWLMSLERSLLFHWKKYKVEKKKTCTNESFKIRSITCILKISSTWVCELNSLTHSAQWRRLVNNDFHEFQSQKDWIASFLKLESSGPNSFQLHWKERTMLYIMTLFCQNQILKERVNCQKRERERFRTNKRECVCVFLPWSDSPLALAVAKTARRQPEVGGFCACSSILNGHSDGECH